MVETISHRQLYASIVSEDCNANYTLDEYEHAQSEKEEEKEQIKNRQT